MKAGYRPLATELGSWSARVHDDIIITVVEDNDVIICSCWSVPCLYKLTSVCICLQIFEARKSCEIDVAKLPEGENMDVNMVSACSLTSFPGRRPAFHRLQCGKVGRALYIISPTVHTASNQKLGVHTHIHTHTHQHTHKQGYGLSFWPRQIELSSNEYAGVVQIQR